MFDPELDEKIRAVARSVDDDAPAPHPFPAETRGSAPGSGPVRDAGDHAPDRARRLVLGITAAVIALVALGAVAWRIERHSGPVVADGGDEPVTTPVEATGRVTVQHEVVTYEMSHDVRCPQGDKFVEGEFETFRVESWSSSELGRWRQIRRYPDGSEREVIAFDSPWYPTSLYSEGELRGVSVGCGNLILLSEPATRSFGLNRSAEIPILPERGEPMVQTYSDLAELVDRSAAGPDGGAVERWVSDNDGTYGGTQGSGSLREVQEWLVDPQTDRIVEQSHRQDWEMIGSVGWRARLETFDIVEVEPDFFATGELSQVTDYQQAPLMEGRDPVTGSLLTGSGTTPRAEQRPIPSTVEADPPRPGGLPVELDIADVARLPCDATALEPPEEFEQILNAVALPTSPASSNALQTGELRADDGTAYYFAKTGLWWRADQAFEIRVPDELRHVLAIGWGAEAERAHTLRVDCDGEPTWQVLPGGFSVSEPMCAEVIVRVGDDEKRVEVGLGKPCAGQSPPAGPSDG